MEQLDYLYVSFSCPILLVHYNYIYRVFLVLLVTLVLLEHRGLLLVIFDYYNDHYYCNYDNRVLVDQMVYREYQERKDLEYV